MASTPTPHIVVAGSGLAGYGVLRELRRLAPASRLTLITHDAGHFYSKPSLSTALAKAKHPDGLITMDAAKVSAQLKLDLRANRLVEAIAPAERVLLTTGGPLPYDALVLALGAEPIRPPIEGDAAHLAISVNHLDDYRNFREKLRPGARILIMGAGLVGSEFANDLALSGYKPIAVDMQSHPLAQLVPAEIGALLQTALAREGVTWHLNRMVMSINHAGPALRIALDDGTRIEADSVLSAIGLRPRTQLGQEAGLTVNRGILVDETGRTSDPHIYAIGDCAEYTIGTAAFVTPIMAAARAIAPSILGTPTKIRFPTLSVQVKTSTCPLVLLPPPRGAKGAWLKTEGTGEHVKFLFRDTTGTDRGYALTGNFCDERMELDRALSAAEEERDAA